MGLVGSRGSGERVKDGGVTTPEEKENRATAHNAGEYRPSKSEIKDMGKRSHEGFAYRYVGTYLPTCPFSSSSLQLIWLSGKILQTHYLQGGH